MDLTLLKQMGAGEQIDLGCLMPGVDETVVQWTATSVVEGTRMIGDSETKFLLVEFSLSYCGVSLGNVRAIETEAGGISWEAIK